MQQRYQLSYWDSQIIAAAAATRTRTSFTPKTSATARFMAPCAAKIRFDRTEPPTPKASHVHPRQRQHQGHHPGLHRQERHVPFRAGDGLWHQARRRRFAGQGRLDPSRPAGLRHGRRGAGRNRRRRQRDLCAAARRGGRDLRGDRRRDAAHRLHHRRHPGARHGAGSSARCRARSRSWSVRTAPAS